MKPWTIYKLDTDTEGSTRFRNPRALSSALGTLQPRALGFLKRVDSSVSVSNLYIVHGFWPKKENFDFGKKGYHRKGHLKRSRMPKFQLHSTFQQ